MEEKESRFVHVISDDNDITDIEELELCTSSRRGPHEKIRRKRTKDAHGKNTKIVKTTGDSRTIDVAYSEYLLEENSDTEVIEYDYRPELFDTDFEEYFESSDEDLNPTPVEKKIPFEIPAPNNDITRMFESAEIEDPVEEDTDEENFHLKEEEDEAPLPKRSFTAPTVSHELSKVQELENDFYTDDDDIDFEKEEMNEIVEELNSWRQAKETNLLEKMDCSSEIDGKNIKWKGIVADVMTARSTIKSLKMCIPSNLSFDELDNEDNSEATEEENCSVRGELVEDDEIINKSYIASDTNDEDFDDSENDMFEDKICNSSEELPFKTSQLSELRFVETDHGPVSIIVTPGIINDPATPKVVDNIPGVAFIENKDENTDVEDLMSDDDDLITKNQSSTPSTDIEDFDIYCNEICSPRTPEIRDIENSLISSPKREMIVIKENKYGVSQITIEKLEDDVSLVDQIDRPSTATQDIDVTFDEALKIFEIQESPYVFENFENENSEISAIMRHKITKHLSLTAVQRDEEELVLLKKPSRKRRRSRKPRNDESTTDEELLSDEENLKSKAHFGTIPVISTDEDTNSEDIEENKFPLDTLEIGVKRTNIHVEGRNKTTSNVLTGQAHLQAIVPEVLSSVTDTEDMERSTAEEFNDETTCNDVIHGENTSITQSEKFYSIRRELDDEMAVKESLKYPLARSDAHTGIESLDGIALTRCDNLSFLFVSLIEIDIFRKYFLAFLEI